MCLCINSILFIFRFPFSFLFWGSFSSVRGGRVQMPVLRRMLAAPHAVRQRDCSAFLQKTRIIQAHSSSSSSSSFFFLKRSSLTFACLLFFLQNCLDGFDEQVCGDAPDPSTPPPQPSSSVQRASLSTSLVLTSVAPPATAVRQQIGKEEEHNIKLGKEEEERGGGGGHKK